MQWDGDCVHVLKDTFPNRKKKKTKVGIVRWTTCSQGRVAQSQRTQENRYRRRVTIILILI